MNKKLLILGAAAGLALAQASFAQESSMPVASLSTAMISCHGITSVPMTLDPEQSLPLKIVATLNCGDQVAVLSDIEGYTINVRTTDGKYGYVARTYIARASQPSPRKPVQIASANVQNGVARWQPGAAGSEELNANGQVVESLTVNGVTVQVSLQDSGWKLRADVAVANDGPAQVSFAPSRFTLDELFPSAKSLAYQDPKQLAKAVNHQILWTAASAAPEAGPRMANAAYHPAAYSSALSQNYLAQHEATVQMVSEHKAEFNPASQINVVALSGASLKTGQKTAGAVWFERDAKPKQLVLRVPVGDVIYEFPLSFEKSK
jgi:hypothetical protein